MSNRQYIEAE